MVGIGNEHLSENCHNVHYELDISVDGVPKDMRVINRLLEKKKI